MGVYIIPEEIFLGVCRGYICVQKLEIQGGREILHDNNSLCVEGMDTIFWNYMYTLKFHTPHIYCK